MTETHFSKIIGAISRHSATGSFLPEIRTTTTKKRFVSTPSPGHCTKPGIEAGPEAGNRVVWSASASACFISRTVRVVGYFEYFELEN